MDRRPMDMHAADIHQTPQFTYLGRLTTVIAASLVEAMAMAYEEDFGRKYAEVVCHSHDPSDNDRRTSRFSSDFFSHPHKQC